jgi:hypothetical protein
MSINSGMLGAGLLAAAVPLANAPVAAAEPVWPVAGADRQVQPLTTWKPRDTTSRSTG